MLLAFHLIIFHSSLISSAKAFLTWGWEDDRGEKGISEKTERGLEGGCAVRVAVSRFRNTKREARVFCSCAECWVQVVGCEGLDLLRIK